jgi:hypothetical protein
MIEMTLEEKEKALCKFAEHTEQNEKTLLDLAGRQEENVETHFQVAQQLELDLQLLSIEEKHHSFEVEMLCMNSG